MRIAELHPWKISPAQAIRIQEKLRFRVKREKAFGEIKTVAGADIAIDTASGEAVGGVVVFGFPDLEEIERKCLRRKLTFPYIPGLLAFREVPVLAEIFRSLKHEPDLVMADGQGIAHPRGLGIASHLGLILDKPTIGCAKSRLVGSYEEPGLSAGSVSDLFYGGEKVGAVLRTRDRARPLFISIGHKINLPTAVDFVLCTCDGTRIPKPTRQADRFVAQAKISFVPIPNF